MTHGSCEVKMTQKIFMPPKVPSSTSFLRGPPPNLLSIRENYKYGGASSYIFLWKDSLGLLRPLLVKSGPTFSSSFQCFYFFIFLFGAPGPPFPSCKSLNGANDFLFSLAFDILLSLSSFQCFYFLFGGLCPRPPFPSCENATGAIVLICTGMWWGVIFGS